MKKIIIALLLCAVTLTGCLPNRDGGISFIENTPVETQILIEAGTIAVGSYFALKDEFPDDSERGLEAIRRADQYLLLSFGTGPLGNKPKYTLTQLIHSEVLNPILGSNDPDMARFKRWAIAARIVIGPDGSLTGVKWIDALLLADEALANDSTVTEEVRNET